MPPRRRLKPLTPELGALGEAVRQLRDEAHLTQETLSQRGAFADFPRLGELERGRHDVKFGSLVTVARALDVPLSEVIGRYEAILSSQEGGK